MRNILYLLILVLLTVPSCKKQAQQLNNCCYKTHNITLQVTGNTNYQKIIDGDCDEANELILSVSCGSNGCGAEIRGLNMDYQFVCDTSNQLKELNQGDVIGINQAYTQQIGSFWSDTKSKPQIKLVGKNNVLIGFRKHVVTNDENYYQYGWAKFNLTDTRTYTIIESALNLNADESINAGEY